MDTGKFGNHFDINVMADGRYRILGAACRVVDVGGREVEDGEIQVEIFVTKGEFLAATGQQILDKLRAAVVVLASSEKAVDVQKRFVGLTIS